MGDSLYGRAALDITASHGLGPLAAALTVAGGSSIGALPTQRYVEGLGGVSVNGPAVAVPAHPNSAGAASQFRSTLATLAGS